MNDQRPCRRGDLECYLLQSVAFTVTDTGHADDYIDYCGYDDTQVDEYCCSNCHNYWPVENRCNPASVEQTWQTVLAHLGEKGVAA